MNPEHQQYLPAIAEHAKEWISPINEPVAPGYISYEWTRGNLAGCYVRETELLQLCLRIMKRDAIDLEIANDDDWASVWCGICKTKGWKETL